MDWSDIGKFIGSAAPVLGTVLGGPVGLIAGAAGKLVANALGCEETPEAVSTAIQADPEAYLKLKTLEDKEKERLLDWKKSQLEADLENIKSARNREATLAQAGDLVGARATHVVALVVTLGFFVMLGLVLYSGSDAVGQAALVLLGSLATGFTAVVQYYLGSSLSSSKKDSSMVGMAKAAQAKGDGK